MSVWFVSPAFGRLEVSDIVYEQRAEMLRDLRDAGVECEALIVADDENLELAERHGLLALSHKNLPLGEKLNAGIGRAYDRGADQVCFIGSDSLALADCFLELPERAVTYGCWYTVISKAPFRQRHARGRAWVEGGELEIKVLHVPIPTWALNVYPRALLRRTRGRPVHAALNRGLDGSIRRQLGDYTEREVNVGAYQVVSVRTEKQITSTETLVQRYVQRDGAWDEMVVAGYGSRVVERIQELYARAPERVRRRNR